MSSTGEDGETSGSEEKENSVIEWSEQVEDHTLAVLEGDLEVEHGVDVDGFDGVRGVAKTNTESYVTDFEEDFEFEDGVLEVSVERDGGLNMVEYWSEDPEVMESFRQYVDQHVRDVEQQPMLEPYMFEDVRSDEVAELVNVFEQEFEMDGPLPRGSNGQPRIHLQRISDLRDENDYRDDAEEKSVTAQHSFPGDARYEIEGLDPDTAGNYSFEMDGTLEIRPQKHDVGRYTVKFSSEDEEALAYMVNTSTRAIDADRDDYLLME